jgi:hypothetical protein
VRISFANAGIMTLTLFARNDPTTRLTRRNATSSAAGLNARLWRPAAFSPSTVTTAGNHDGRDSSVSLCKGTWPKRQSSNSGRPQRNREGTATEMTYGRIFSRSVHIGSCDFSTLRCRPAIANRSEDNRPAVQRAVEPRRAHRLGREDRRLPRRRCTRANFLRASPSIMLNIDSVLLAMPEIRTTRTASATNVTDTLPHAEWGDGKVEERYS